MTFVNPVYANGKELGTLEGLGPLGKFTISIEHATKLFNMVISATIGVMTVIAGIWFIFNFITGAFGWMTAGGDKAKVQAAQTKIVQGIIGLVVVVAAVFIIDLVGTLLGLDILSPGKFARDVWSGI